MTGRPVPWWLHSPKCHGRVHQKVCCQTSAACHPDRPGSRCLERERTRAAIIENCRQSPGFDGNREARAVGGIVAAFLARQKLRHSLVNESSTEHDVEDGQCRTSFHDRLCIARYPLDEADGAYMSLEGLPCEDGGLCQHALQLCAFGCGSFMECKRVVRGTLVLLSNRLRWRRNPRHQRDRESKV
jgi:hypothetical protein